MRTAVRSSVLRAVPLTDDSDNTCPRGSYEFCCYVEGVEGAPPAAAGSNFEHVGL